MVNSPAIPANLAVTSLHFLTTRSVVAAAAVPLPLSGAALPRESPRLPGVLLLESQLVPPVPAEEAAVTLAEHIQAHFRRPVHVGDRLALGPYRSRCTYLISS